MGGAVNTSSYPTGAYQPLDASKILDLVQKGSEFAVGRHAQEATKNGVFDPQDFMARIAADPAAARATPEAITRALAQQGQQVHNAQAGFNIAGDWQQATAQGLTSLLSRPNGPTVRDVMGVITNLKARGTPDHIIAPMLQGLPSERDENTPRGRAMIVDTVNKAQALLQAPSDQTAPATSGFTP